MTTRTISPYFSPKRAIAPIRTASVLRHLFDDDGNIFADFLVDQPLDVSNLLVRHFCKMRKVEPQRCVIDQRAFLCDMVPQGLP